MEPAPPQYLRNWFFGKGNILSWVSYLNFRKGNYLRLSQIVILVYIRCMLTSSFSFHKTILEPGTETEIWTKGMFTCLLTTFHCKGCQLLWYEGLHQTTATDSKQNPQKYTRRVERKRERGCYHQRKIPWQMSCVVVGNTPVPHQILAGLNWAYHEWNQENSTCSSTLPPF